MFGEFSVIDPPRGRPFGGGGVHPLIVWRAANDYYHFQGSCAYFNPCDFPVPNFLKIYSQDWIMHKK
jgi:hypothetical protein